LLCSPYIILLSHTNFSGFSFVLSSINLVILGKITECIRTVFVQSTQNEKHKLICINNLQYFIIRFFPVILVVSLSRLFFSVLPTAIFAVQIKIFPVALIFLKVLADPLYSAKKFNFQNAITHSVFVQLTPNEKLKLIYINNLKYFIIRFFPSVLVVVLFAKVKSPTLIYDFALLTIYYFAFSHKFFWL